MTNNPNRSGPSQVASGRNDGDRDQEGQTTRGPGDGQRSAQQQQLELPEHQGVITDYVPPKGGVRSEVGDPAATGGDDDVGSDEAGDEPLPGHMGGGLAGG